MGIDASATVGFGVAPKGDYGFEFEEGEHGFTEESWGDALDASWNLEAALEQGFQVESFAYGEDPRYFFAVPGTVQTVYYGECDRLEQPDVHGNKLVVFLEVMGELGIDVSGIGWHVMPYLSL